MLSNHIRFTDASLSSLTKLSITYFIILANLLFKKGPALTDFKKLLYVLNLGFTFTITYLLTLTSTLYSFIFLLEVLNLTVLGALLTSLLNFFNHKGRGLRTNYSSVVNSFVIFF